MLDVSVTEGVPVSAVVVTDLRKSYGQVDAVRG